MSGLRGLNRLRVPYVVAGLSPRSGGYTSAILGLTAALRARLASNALQDLRRDHSIIAGADVYESLFKACMK